MKRLSVIIPMYNVEPYVEKCIRSLETQDISGDEFEIICINDGSPDNSRDVVKRLQQEFKNLILIDQENRGVSCARNRGIEQATGKYLLFIDPDDFVNPFSFGRVLNKADRHQAEVAFLGFTFLREDGTLYMHVLNENYTSEVYEGIEAYFLGRKGNSVDPDRMCGVLFDRTFINRNGLRYIIDVPYLEDGELIARILCLAKRCIYDGHSFYQRTTRLGSATNSNLFHTERASRGFLMAATKLREFQEGGKLEMDQRLFLNQPICKFVFLASYSALQRPYFSNFRRVRKELVARGLIKIEQQGVVKPYSYYVPYFNASLFFFLLLYRMKEIKESFSIFLRRTNKHL